jgi:mono/diheme cytochrome c family protein
MNSKLLYIIATGLVLITLGCTSDKPDTSATPAQEVKKEAELEVPKAPATMPESQNAGEVLFKMFCIKCHKGGGNLLNKDKPIHRKALAARHKDNVESIIKTMRNPGPKMLKFNEATISNDDARKIAEYILKTFQ